MMSLPANWELGSIGELFETSTGATPKKSQPDNYGNDVPFVKPPELLNTDIFDTADNLSFKGAASSRTLPPGSILISCIGNLGKVGINSETVAFNQQINAIKPNDNYISKFMFFQALSEGFKVQLEKLASGTTVPIVNKSKFNSIEVVLPPIPEQKKIVALLDTVFTDLEQTRAKTEQNLKNARELFDSYLQQVFSQKGEGWVETTLGEITGGIATGPFGSLLHKSDYIENGIPLVNPAHIVGQKIVPDQRKTISDETALRLSNYKMKAVDIVIGRRGEMGRCALITQTEDGYLCGTGSFIIKSSDRCDGGFLVRFLRSASCVASLEKIAGGAVMPNLSNSSLSNFSIRVPSKNKQIEITKLIDKLSIEIEKIIDIYQKKLSSIDELKKSILQKAFSGELNTTAE